MFLLYLKAIINATTYRFNSFFIVLLQLAYDCVQKHGKNFPNMKIWAKFSYVNNLTHIPYAYHYEIIAAYTIVVLT